MTFDIVIVMIVTIIIVIIFKIVIDNTIVTDTIVIAIDTTSPLVAVRLTALTIQTSKSVYYLVELYSTSSNCSFGQDIA